METNFFCKINTHLEIFKYLAQDLILEQPCSAVIKASVDG